MVLILDDTTRDAVLAVMEERMSVSAASKHYKIPRKTIKYLIQDRIRKGFTVLPRPAGPPYFAHFSKEDEENIAQVFVYLVNHGLPHDLSTEQRIFFDYTDFFGVHNNFVDDRADPGWIREFKERNEHILKGQLIETASSLIPKTSKEFHKKWRAVLSENNLTNRPEAIFCLDDWAITTHIVDAQVNVKKTTRHDFINPPDDIKGSVLFCASAAGVYLPPMAVYKGCDRDCFTVTQTDLIKSGVLKAFYTSNASGLMDHNLSYWFSHVFVEAVKQMEKPVLLCADWHKIGTHYLIVNEAREHNIILVTIPSDVSPSLQPFDIGVISSVNTTWNEALDWLKRESGKHTWSQIVEWRNTEYREQNGDMDKNLYARLLSILWSSLESQLIIDAFDKSGMYPLTEDLNI